MIIKKIVTYEFYLPEIPFNYDVSEALANLVQKYYDEYYHLKRQYWYYEGLQDCYEDKDLSK